jgi:hypothetical protein
MSGFKGKAVAVAAVALIVLAALGAEASAAKPKKKAAPLCAMGASTTKAKPCKVNPAYAKDGCKVFELTVSTLVGSPATAGQNRGAPTNLGCYFIISGTKQAFGISVGVMPANGPSATAYLQSTFDNYVKEASGMMCSSPTPPAHAMNAPVALTGLGDAAFAWQMCTPHGQFDSTSVEAAKGNFYYAASGQYPIADPSVDQLVSLIRQLMAKYH